MSRITRLPLRLRPQVAAAYWIDEQNELLWLETPWQNSRSFVLLIELFQFRKWYSRGILERDARVAQALLLCMSD